MTCTNFPKTGLVPNVTTHIVGDVTYLWSGIVWEAITAPLKHSQLSEKDITGAHEAASISNRDRGSVQKFLDDVIDPMVGGRVVALDKYSNVHRRSLMMDYIERSRPKTGIKLKNKLDGDAFIIFVGDSHTAGQGSTDTGGVIVPNMPPPAGVTDGFHKRVNESGTFSDIIARKLRSELYLGNVDRVASSLEETYYHIYTGTWEKGSLPGVVDVFGVNTYSASNVVGDSVIKKSDQYFQRDWFEVHFRKYGSGGVLKVEFRDVQPFGTVNLTRNKYSAWTDPTVIGATRNDSPTNINEIDCYSAVSSYGEYVRYKMPYPSIWEIRLTIDRAGTGAGTGAYLFSTVLERCQFLNAGRGNHTTLDYVGEPVSFGAGGSGDMDHTDHLSEVLAYNPTLIVLEPMIINDWFHGVYIGDTFSALSEILRRINESGCDCIILGTAPVITETFPYDWSENPDSATLPPLVDSIKGKGTYVNYYNVVERVAGIYNVPVINNFYHFLYRFYKDDHQNWTIGSLAGRIHVNQFGHQIYADSFIRYSGLSNPTID